MSKFATAIIAAAATLALATPSLASETRSVKVKTVQRNGQTLYCIKQGVTTGSIMSRDICKTKEDWAESGVTVVAAADKAGKLAANPQQAAAQN
ncbi:hypothetical protein [Sphingobium nicotianae]|uniref:Secreted protein n=1 Tax=Sphingobium nicotianae TaxID=2782607 RepID=A0A9X1ISP4_9SPHN|nr:hypothetical protein [Sphingobium nicotianae]MBT2188713.1 hypothetical protein [Sphingobium nicotianae]